MIKMIISAIIAIVVIYLSFEIVAIDVTTHLQDIQVALFMLLIGPAAASLFLYKDAKLDIEISRKYPKK